MRNVRALVVVIVAAFAATMAAAGLAPAAEATTYRYWVYWHHTDGSWSYSGVGPSGYRVPDGGVEGWRFGRGESSSSVATPRLGGEYEKLCPDAPATANGTQVAVVIDYGTESDSPGYPTRAHCVTLTDDHQGSDALVKAAGSLRVENGMVCAIRSYPKAPECGKTVEDPKPSPKPTTPRPAASSAPPVSAPSTPTTRVGGAATTSAPTASSAPPSTPTASADTAPSATATSVASDSAAGTSDNAIVDSGDSDPAVPNDVPYGLVAGGVLVIALGTAAAVRARR